MFAVLCCLAFGAAPAAAKQRRYAFLVTNVSMSEVVTFHGDHAGNCEHFGVCGYSGTVSYSFGSGDGLAAFVFLGRRAAGTGDFFFDGLTSATVQGPGGGAPCTDRIIRTFDGFEVSGHAGRMRLLFHPPIDGPDFLDTYCAGPRDLDLWHAHALPTITLSERSLKARTLRLQKSSTRPFRTGPFSGTLAFQVDMRLRRVKNLASIIRFLAGDL